MKTSQYRKKQVVIEAMKVRELLSTVSTREGDWPRWASESFDSGTIRLGHHSVEIETLEGTMVGNAGDWVIRGIKGELYPCKPDIFAATYEAIADDPDEGGIWLRPVHHDEPCAAHLAKGGSS